MSAFLRAYIDAALWSSTDESNDAGGDPLDDNYTADDLDNGTLAKMRLDCETFQAQQGHLIAGREEQAGHDFWLTRNGHGCGFWDGDWEEPAGAILTLASTAFGSFDLTVHEGKVYGS